MAARHISILHSIVSDKAGSQGWLEQRLAEEQQTSNSKGRRSQARQLDHAPRHAQDEKGGGAGFVKIERGRRAAERHGNSSSTKGLSEDVGDETEVTLMAKDLAAKAKWQRSGEAKSRMQDRLRDSSLAVWQRRKIELKLKLGSEKWEPAKKIATSSMEKIRLLNSEFPEVWTMQRLSEQFKVSQETIRRILKSKFRPSEQRTERRELKRKTEMETYKEQTKLRGSSTHGSSSSGGSIDM
ncbi:Required for respiratory growth protein 9 mitochondrial [Coemansia aciculifera]|nr:Required for respiratory growth protein 9 mitochondrial [Coemansia aciculifera]